MKLLSLLLKPPAAFSLQQQAGLLHVYAPEAFQKQVHALLEQLSRHVSGQVLIEAKIVEVTLKDAYRGSIDWAQLQHKSLKAKAALGSVFRTPPALMGHMGREGMMSLSFADSHLQTLLSLWNLLGPCVPSRVRALRCCITKCLLKVAENQIFFDVKYERQFLGSDQKKLWDIE